MNESNFIGRLCITDEFDDDGIFVSLSYFPGIDGRPGALHGGAIIALIDNSANKILAAEHAAVKPKATTKFYLSDSNVEFLRLAAPQKTFARSKILHLGKGSALVTTRAWQSSPEKLVAFASHRFLAERI